MKIARENLFKLVTALANSLIWFSALVFFLWAVGALHQLLLLPSWLRTTLAIVYAVAVPVWIWRSSNRSKTRSWVVGSILFIYGMTLLIHPSNDRVWDPDHVQVAEASIVDGTVTINNFRNCVYLSLIHI